MTILNMQLTAAITLTTGVLTRLKIVCLENEKREAKKKYNDTLKLYVKEMLGRPMEKINVRNKSVLSEDPASFCRMDFTDAKLKALYLWVILLMSSESSKTCFLTCELRACARASYRYDVGNGIRSIGRFL